jgi:hypothetical protein
MAKKKPTAEDVIALFNLLSSQERERVVMIEKSPVMEMAAGLINVAIVSYIKYERFVNEQLAVLKRFGHGTEYDFSAWETFQKRLAAMVRSQPKIQQLMNANPAVVIPDFYLKEKTIPRDINDSVLVYRDKANGLSWKEMEAKYGISCSTLRSTHRRACSLIKRLRQDLDELQRINDTEYKICLSILADVHSM